MDLTNDLIKEMRKELAKTMKEMRQELVEVRGEVKALNDDNKRLILKVGKLETNIANPPPPSVTASGTVKETYAQKAKKETNTLVLKSTGNQSDTQIKEVVKNYLKDVKIDKMRTTKKGSIVLNLPDPAMMEIAKKCLNDKVDEHKLETVEAKKFDPKIIVTHVSIDEDKEEVVDSILR